MWANQWEPPGTERKQFAWRCYEERFGTGSCVNRDIEQVLNDLEEGKTEIPDFDMLVGGFPCQDYSVARPKNQASGIEGKKGVLWWSIYRLLHLRKPRYLLLENVDRLLKSPGNQRGRDFAIMLSCLAEEGYSVEWRVINAADYGMPQKRRRVYIFGELADRTWDLPDRVMDSGLFAKAFPVLPAVGGRGSFSVDKDPYEVSKTFGRGLTVSPFMNAGAMQNGTVFTAKTFATYEGNRMTLGDLLVPDAEVPAEFFIEEDKIPAWEAGRAAKRIDRVSKSGHPYVYTEGSMPWPDPTDKPARTILTSEGGKGASRMKHAVRGDSGRIRRLVPDELDQIQMFPKGWTNTGMTDGHRAFCMGNALVVGIPHRLGEELAKRL
ncbi:cytosine-specific methyltransferase [Granulimonas faecalis]|uniref:Cytosine-specific methyltransferase n=1 Tax=Granulimonas faecalis TaxID=2894155 RepID=A0AAV5B6B2_9ACTN|nr:DNA (cytosine-5-)-methyltransferase [Granulimonas faecalis]GJM55919.1 cytosine-specific methyltransferase [Granulimonas faecalis]